MSPFKLLASRRWDDVEFIKGFRDDADDGDNVFYFVLFEDL